MDIQKAKELFENYLHRRYSDRSTPKHYMSDLGIFLHGLGDKPLEEVTYHDVDRFVDQQHELGMSPSTINRRLAALHTFFECLAAEEPDRPWPNPVIWRRHKVKEGKPLPRDASEREVEQLFAVIGDPRDAAMFGLMVGAGLRVDEVAHLHLADLEAPTSPDQMARLRVWPVLWPGTGGKGRKERVVWLTPKGYAQVAAWLKVRPADAEDDHLFLNQHGRAITLTGTSSKDGIQYRLKGYCQAARIDITCHQLRHTFARRLAEQKMPIEGIAKLMGHAQVETTQRYIAGADPDLRDQFQQVMAQLEAQQAASPPVTASLPAPQPQRTREKADPTQLELAVRRFDSLPEWLSAPLGDYLRRCWRNWKPHMAVEHAHRLARQLVSIWCWLLIHRAIVRWSDLQRSDVEAWLASRQAAGIAINTLRKELSDLLSFLHFVVDQEVPLNANLFRVAYPESPAPLPRALPEAEYARLIETVLAETSAQTAAAVQERAWFLTLAHTGVRVNELLNLRLGDLDLTGRRLFVRNAKNGQDRVVFLTPSLAEALQGHLAQRPDTDDDHLWLSDGRRLTAPHIRYRLRQWGQLCGVAVTPHRLRHTLATRLINQGMPLGSVSQLLGHESLRMTQRYARLYDATVKEQFESAVAHIEGIAVSNWPTPATTPLVTQSADSV